MAQKITTVLCILDGWGLSDNPKSNAIAAASTPNWDTWIKTYPMARLDASGKAVGLPHGQMGNSEVGHMTIGAGRCILQDLPLINKAITENQIPEKTQWQNFINKTKAANNVCHVMGLFSPGGIHSHQDHYIAFVKLLSDAGIKVHLHLFTDGRDTPPKSAEKYLQFLMNELGDDCEISTISGRFYAMDRDKRWDRVEQSYNAIIEGDAPKFNEPLAYIQQSYKQDVYDEFIVPGVSENYTGVKDGDALLLVNFRADRVREILSSFFMPGFDGFQRQREIKWAATLGMKDYSNELIPYITPLFPFESPKNTLGEILEKAGKTQLRAAETEKYAHVTFFLNGGYETKFKGEERVLIPSPKVKTYDLKPEMSAPELTQAVKDAIESQKFDLIVVNYANPDMVGHTGNLKASIKAVEVVDKCLGDLVNSTLSQNGNFIITADHGNIEQLKDLNGDQPHTAHTTNFVPFMLINKDINELKDTGSLMDITPTILKLMNIEKPIEMTGKSLIIEK